MANPFNITPPSLSTALPPQVVPNPAAVGVPPPAAPQPVAQSTGVLNSSAGAVTFAGAPAGVFVIWKILQATGDWAKETYVGFAIALVVGVMIWFASAAPPPEHDSQQAKIGRILSAMFSIAGLIAATLGIKSVT